MNDLLSATKLMKISAGRLVFQFNVSMLILYLLTVLTLIALGRWQLSRAEEKKSYLSKIQAEHSVIIDNRTLDSDTFEINQSIYKQTRLFGQYDVDHQFLIDNQIKNGQAGYFIMTPFKLQDSDSAVLVNRGWLPLINNNRETLPKLEISTIETQITGRINHFPSVGIRLKGAETPSPGWPSVVQVANPKILSERLGYLLFAFQVELDPNMKDGYLRKWNSNNIMPPEKHVAYAFQWFALALTLTIIFLVLSQKKS